MSYTVSLFHIVFCTHSRRRTLTYKHNQEVANYMTAIINDKKSKRLAIKVMPEHVHILLDLNTTTPLSEMIKSIKQSSSLWLHKHPDKFPYFDRWAKEYYAASISFSHKDAVSNYIANQESHHSVVNFYDEIKRLVERSGMGLFRDKFEQDEESSTQMPDGPQ